MPETTILRTVYDFGREPMRYGTAAIPFILAIVGIVLVVFALKTHRENNNQSKTLMIGLIMTVGSLLISNFILNNSDYKKTQQLLISGNYQTVRDTVKNYKKEYHKSTWYITFDIGSVHFELNDNNITNYGCTANDIKDSRIMDGVYLYIDYFKTDSGNKILRIKRE